MEQEKTDIEKIDARLEEIDSMIDGLNTYNSRQKAIEGEKEDLLHILELRDDLTKPQKGDIAVKLSEVLKKRRVIKDEYRRVQMYITRIFDNGLNKGDLKGILEAAKQRALTVRDKLKEIDDTPRVYGMSAFNKGGILQEMDRDQIIESITEVD